MIVRRGVGRLLGALLCAALTWAGAARAQAQECAEGRVASEATQGRCCWPGQSWSDPYGRCVGAPRCPEGLVADGDRCVAPIAPPAPAPVAPLPEPAETPGEAAAPPVPAEHPPVSWAAFEGPRPRGALAPELVAAPDEGWLVFGGVAFGFGWAVSVVVGSIVGLASEQCTELGGYAFVPVVGGILHGATYEACDEALADSIGLWGPYIPATIAQVGGVLAMIFSALLSNAEVLSFESLTFHVPGADVGVGLRQSF